MISEQVHYLKELGNDGEVDMVGIHELNRIFNDAADTIGALSAKLAEYEALGVTPEQLRQIDGMYADRCKEIWGLRKRLEGTSEAVM